MKKKELEIYIHIPFCVRKCAYCDFLSGPAAPEEQKAYVRALIKEIRAAACYRSRYEVTTIFFGGGTPSLLAGEQLDEIMKAIKESFLIRKDAEITMEMNPGTANREKLKAYRRVGINRLSIGLQSANNQELKILGRIHTFETFLETYQMAREEGFDNINVDLMSALPGQTEESYEETVQKVLTLAPEHISSYSLIIEEGTPFFEWYGKGESGNMPELPDEDTERCMYRRTKELLEEAGYYRYEVSNYALPGKECRHNIGYWERKDYLGFGIGAASLLEENRFSNVRDRSVYVQALEQYEGEEVFAAIRTEKEVLSKEDQMSETMILGLRMMKGIAKDEFHKRFGKAMDEVYGDVLKKYIDWNLLELTQDNRVRFTEQGISVSNIVLADFL
ncbi:oxygen-independent coproporphyrinogen III oxidase [Faecalicatena sp. Marseille-Q4148]|nr:oxygen-independent coproporphyrinogen III oxidase [Faecalicatena sp. Marseille-Q4148]